VVSGLEAEGVGGKGTAKGEGEHTYGRGSPSEAEGGNRKKTHETVHREKKKLKNPKATSVGGKEGSRKEAQGISSLVKKNGKF